MSKFNKYYFVVRLLGLFFVSSLPLHLLKADEAKLGVMPIAGKKTSTTKQPSAGLDQCSWQSIQEQILAHPTKAKAHETGALSTTNPSHGFYIEYRRDGQTTIQPLDPQNTDFQVSLRLKGLGYAKIQDLGQPEKLINNDLGVGSGSKVTYQWGSLLTEWWINDHNRLEQWFYLRKAPVGRSKGALLRLSLQLNTNMAITCKDNQLFLKRNGRKITYSKLRVWDARGKELKANIHLDKSRIELRIADENAVYPLLIDPSFAQQAYLKASNTETDDEFGSSVAISGQTLVVGAPRESSNAKGINGNQYNNGAYSSGAVYVFVRTGDKWTQQAYLKASNTNEWDLFGTSVAISGETIVVGAPGEDSNAKGVNGNQSNNSAQNAGAAYVFVRNGGKWTQQAYLKASNTYRDNEFGSSVAISGETIVIGAPGENRNSRGVNGNQYDNDVHDTGAAYAFVRASGRWTQQAYIKASNTGVRDAFGASVAISEETIVVGAPSERSNAKGINGNQFNNDVHTAGAAYVFVRNGGKWTQQAYLKASNTDQEAFFGYSVAISRGTIVIGAHGESSDAKGVNGDQNNNIKAHRSGAAYVFARTGDVWRQQAYLKASNSDSQRHFGRTVAIDGETIVIGAPYEDSSAKGVNGDQSNNDTYRSGAAYVFARTGSEWRQQAYLKASNTDFRDNFGIAAAISDSSIVIGARFESSSAKGVNGDQDNNDASSSGAAYVFNSTLLNLDTTQSDSTSLVDLVDGEINSKIIPDQGITFKVFPNPTSGGVTVELAQSISNGKIVIENAMGRIVASQNLDQTDQYSLDLSSFPKGLYTFKIITSSGTAAIQRVIVH